MEHYQAILLILIIISLGCTTVPGADEQDSLTVNCCVPFCTSAENEQACAEAGGTFAATSCSEVDECKSGCCTPFCAETTQVLCGEEYGYGGVWHEELLCSELEECSICCAPAYNLMPRTVCEQAGGTEVSHDLCGGAGSITVQVSHQVSCNCNEELGEDETCIQTLDIVQSFTVNLVPDTVAEADNGILSWLNWETVYHYKGTGTYTLSGSEDMSSHYEYMQTCLNPEAPIGSKGLIATDTSNNREFSASNTDEVTATITVKSDGKYDIEWNYPSMSGIMAEHFTRTTTSGCAGISPYTYGDDSEIEIEGAIIEYVIYDAELSGSKTFTQYPPEDMFACESINNSGTGTITWTFNLTE